MAMPTATRSPIRFIASVALLCSVGVVLLVIRFIASDSLRYVFLIWNLLLALIVPLLAWLLVYRVQQFGWLRWQQIILTVLWFVFLPNTFYLVTDFIHVRQTYEASLVYDVTMLTSFVFSGLLLGYLSMFLVHRELVKRLSSRNAWLAIGIWFLASSFAIYLGRYTRWNSWDIFIKPAGLLFDVSDRFINPTAYYETYETTLIFFVLLFAGYLVVWEAYQLMVPPKKRRR